MSRLPEQNSFSMSVQRQLSNSMLMEASYSGAIGSHLKAGLLNHDQLPFGKGQTFMNSGWGAWILGDWRLAFIGTYNSGRPVGLSTSVGTPLQAGRNVPWVTTYDGWRAPTKGDKFNPQVDSFWQPASYFGPQPSNTIGNMTRFNPRQRELPALNERFSISKEFRVHEAMHFELRGEAFNAFNRVRFAVGDTNVTGSNFGRVTGTYNSPRQIQVGAKFQF